MKSLPIVALYCLLASLGGLSARSASQRVDAGTDAGLRVVLFVAPGREQSEHMARLMRTDSRVATAILGLALESVDSGRHPERYSRLIGRAGCCGLAVVDANDVALAAIEGTAQGAQIIGFFDRLRATVAPLRRCLDRLAVEPHDEWSREQLMELQLAMGSDGLACNQAKLLTLSTDHSRQQRGRAVVARFEALFGRSDHARAELSKIGNPPQELSDELRLTEAIVRCRELVPAAAIHLLDGEFSGTDEDTVLRLVTLGDALHQAGDSKRAVRVLERVVADHRSSRWYAQACDQLAHLYSPAHGHSH